MTDTDEIYRFRPADLALLATAGPSKLSLFSFSFYFVSALVRCVFFASIFLASGYASISSVVVRFWVSGRRWILHRLSPAFASGVVPFLLGRWSPAFVYHGCVRAVEDVVTCGGLVAEFGEGLGGTDGRSLKVGPFPE
ncbi:Uncharacterized protein Rs2_30182 [Raphanus sativus]|nr:Uncharacterized protein Rs2_30182 [Raphanus sativus]